jgi:hypothetical protein
MLACLLLHGGKYNKWQYDECMIQKACELLYLSTTDTQHRWFYQMFQGWCNPRTKNFKYGLNLECAEYNMMGEEIKQGITISDRQVEEQINLTLEETNKGPHSKDDATFALLIAISPHTVTMFNEIDNLPRLDVILNGEPIGLGNHVSQ